jgi:hypothetical protein
MRKSFTTYFECKDEVYLKSDPEKKGTVSGFLVREHGLDMVGITSGEDETFHRPCDLAKIRKFIIRGFRG